MAGVDALVEAGMRLELAQVWRAEVVCRIGVAAEAPRAAHASTMIDSAPFAHWREDPGPEEIGVTRPVLCAAPLRLWGEVLVGLTHANHGVVSYC